ncbi:SAM-dependent methyltransferase [Paracraurococcus lichenis]|uniref:SAM-dependent methyltransferase n=1 Tax=Paracraurococcus lichenis TaxID=3064888 RepID=A0ABT9E000_9PROT|nr:SAM-dependent methyltransferase [Paracraurococcus sp. LOR1-02]MDO9709476.1 SAM-dependent methyltransferase [Paracraurococcus sp. LOR1-02]
MSRRAERTLPPGYFEALYAADPDPWRFASSDYERDKYAATIAALPRPRYGRAFEIGCSIGVLTAQLAARCDALLAVDAAEAPLAAAQARCAGLPKVAFRRMAVPADWPEGRFDLILLSEVVYYLDAADGARLARRVAESLTPGGEALLVHWTEETDYPLSGDAATEGFIAAAGLPVIRQQRAARYRLDLLGRQGSGPDPSP